MRARTDDGSTSLSALREPPEVRDLSAEVAELRRARIDQLGAALDAARQGTWAARSPRSGERLELALVSHSVAALEAAALADDRERADLILKTHAVAESDLSALIDTAAGKIVAVDSSVVHPVIRPDSDMPVWLAAGPVLSTSNPALHRLLISAVQSAVDIGYGWVLGNALGIAVFLSRRSLDETSSSWTASILPCTIALDYYDSPELTGMDLLHECCHAWLNDCLAARGAIIPSEPHLYSPWRGTMRPPFGLVHATFAFSCLVNYLTLLGQRATLASDVEAYRSSRVALERARLAQAHEQVSTALDLLSDDDIRAMIETELESALETA